MPKLIKRVADGAVIRERDYVLWDEALPRFGLRVRSSGTKTYVVQYRFKGRTRHVTLGHHGVLTPAEARSEALRGPPDRELHDLATSAGRRDAHPTMHPATSRVSAVIPTE